MYAFVPWCTPLSLPAPPSQTPPVLYDHQCFCGTADELENAVESDKCGKTYPTLCTGDATRACGGFGAMSVFGRTGDAAPAPAPVPAPTPTVTPETTYSIVGCFADSKADRIMENMMVGDVMSAEVSWRCERQTRVTCDLEGILKP